MPTAYVHIRETPHYRRDSFTQGLTRLGYTVVNRVPSAQLRPKDVVVIWNKTSRSASLIQMARRGGAALLVAENGYFGTDENGVQRYALALDGHNGSGRWHAPDDSRLAKLKIDWRPFDTERNGPVLVCAQRGIGSPRMRSPPLWAEKVATRCREHGLQAFVRPHPGSDKPATALEDDLARASAVLVWSSNCATRALISGVPTFYDAPAIVTAGAAAPLKDFPWGGGGLRPYDRLTAFARMAWAQWTIAELQSGEPFRLLLDIHAGKLPYVGAWNDRT